MLFRCSASRAVAAVLALLLCVAPAGAQENKLTIFAAASLKNALDDVNAAWTASTGKAATISYAASSALAKQIEAGAPADIFISADLDWMDYVERKKLVREGTRSSLLGNRIVLIAPKDSALSLTLAPGVDLAAALNGGLLSMGNTDGVPAGKYGKAALQRLGAWDGVKNKIAQAENVRAALLLVSRGEAPLGIVYKTDAASDRSVRVVDTFPQDTHPPIVYPAAILSASANPDGAAYLQFLRSPAAVAAFEKQGFAVLD